MMRLYQYSVVLILFLSTALTSVAQQFIQTNLYQQNRFFYNPANAGYHDHLSIFLSHRQQWMEFEGAPVTSILSAHSPVGKNVGVGLNLVSDRTDILERLSGNLNYAYTVRFRDDHTLSFGIAGGFVQNSISIEDVNVPDPSDIVLSDGKFQATTVDADFGLRYNIKGFEFGASAANIFEMSINYERELEDQDYMLRRHLVGYAGYRFKLGKKKHWIIEPSVLYRVFPYEETGFDYEYNQYDGNLNFYYKDIAWVGGTYRQDAGYVVSAGLKVAEQVSIAYAYEFSTTAIAAESNGSHEAMVSFHLFNRKDAEQDEELARLKQQQDSINSRVDSLFALNEKRKPEKDEELQKAVEENTRRIDELETDVDRQDEEIADLETEVDFIKMQLDTTNIQNLLTQVRKEIDKETGEERLVEEPLERGYYVVIESFRNFDYADKYQKGFNERGAKAIIVHNKERGWYYVYTQKYNDLKTALEAMEETRKRGFEDAWVHIYKR